MEGLKFNFGKFVLDPDGREAYPLSVPQDQLLTGN
jgi:hypothetical protein